MAAADGLGRSALSERIRMPRKLPQRYFHLVFSFLMAAAMVSIVTFVVTATTGGEGAFLARWLRAFACGYAVAVPVIYVAAPRVRRLTARLVDSGA